MKKYRIKCILPMLFIGLLLISCSQEEEINLEKQNEGINRISLMKYSNPTARGGQSSMLVFDSMSTLKETVNQLEVDTENYDDTFIEQWGFLNDESLNAKEVELGYVDSLPLTIFEDNYSHVSLRKKFLSDEENWLNNENLDELNTPLNKDIYDFDEVEMSVMNQTGEFKINHTIYKKLTKMQVLGVKNYMPFPFESGFILIDDANVDDLMAFNNGDYSLILNTNFKFLPDDPFDLPDYGGGTNYPDPNDDIYSTCKGNKVKTRFYVTGYNKKVWAKVKMGGRRAKAKLRSYKKKRRRWRKWRTYMEVAVRGNIRDKNQCGFFEIANRKRTGRKKRIKSVQIMPENYKKVLRNELVNANKHNGVDNILYLTW